MIFLLQARPVKADLSTWWYVSLTALTALEVTTKVCRIKLCRKKSRYSLSKLKQYREKQCWTKGRSSMAVAEDLRPTATVAEV